jgi:hypothetical protein
VLLVVLPDFHGQLRKAHVANLCLESTAQQYARRLQCTVLYLHTPYTCK